MSETLARSKHAGVRVCPKWDNGSRCAWWRERRSNESGGESENAHSLIPFDTLRGPYAATDRRSKYKSGQR